MHVLRVPLDVEEHDVFGYVRAPILPPRLRARRWEQCGGEELAGKGHVFIQVAQANADELATVEAMGGQVVRGATTRELKATRKLQRLLAKTPVPPAGERFELLEDYHRPALEALAEWLARDARMLATYASDGFAGAAAALNGRVLDNSGGGSGVAAWVDALGGLSTDGAGAVVVNAGAGFAIVSDGTPVTGDLHAEIECVLGSSGGPLFNFGVCSRQNAAADDTYFAWSAPASGDALYLRVAGVNTQIAGGGAITVGTRYGCMAIATTISRTIAGVVNVSAIDATLATGTGGCLAFRPDAGIKLDDYAIANNVAPVTTSRVPNPGKVTRHPGELISPGRVLKP